MRKEDLSLRHSLIHWDFEMKMQLPSFPSYLWPLPMKKRAGRTAQKSLLRLQSKKVVLLLRFHSGTNWCRLVASYSFVVVVEGAFVVGVFAVPVVAEEVFVVPAFAERVSVVPVVAGGVFVALAAAVAASFVAKVFAALVVVAEEAAVAAVVGEASVALVAVAGEVAAVAAGLQRTGRSAG